MACCFYLHVSQPLFLNPGVSRIRQGAILVAMAKCIHWRCQYKAHPNIELFKGFCCGLCEEWQQKPKRKNRHGRQLHWCIEKMFFILNLCGHHWLQKKTPQRSSNSKGEIWFVAFSQRSPSTRHHQGLTVGISPRNAFLIRFHMFALIIYVPPTCWSYCLHALIGIITEILFPGWSTEIACIQFSSSCFFSLTCKMCHMFPVSWRRSKVLPAHPFRWAPRNRERCDITAIIERRGLLAVGGC